MDNEKAPAMDWNSLQVPLAGEREHLTSCLQQPLKNVKIT
jgi:hypothetical protein